MHPASDRPGQAEHRQAAGKQAEQAQAVDMKVVDKQADKAAARPVVQAEAEPVSLEPAVPAGHIAQPEAVLRSSHKTYYRWYMLRN